MTQFERSDLNMIGTCIDGMIKQGGVEAARALLPLFAKVEQIAKEMDAKAEEDATKA